MNQKDKLRSFAISFFIHFRNTYYQLKDERIHLCRYVLHEMLHIADSIENCGPVSMLAQWNTEKNTENYIGNLTRRCNAKALFGESLSANLRFQQSSRLLSMNSNLDIKYLTYETDNRNSIPSIPCRVISQQSCEGMSLLHPHHLFSISSLSSKLGINMKNLLVSFFAREGILSRSEGFGLFDESFIISVFSRCEDMTNVSKRHIVYRSEFGSTKTMRRHYYFGGVYSDDSTSLDIYYGKALAFISLKVNNVVYCLVLASWTNCLKRGRFGLVYAEKDLDSRTLFVNPRLDEVKVMSHPISLVQCSSRDSKGKGKWTRTFFIDEVIAPQRFDDGTDPLVLKGISTGQ